MEIRQADLSDLEQLAVLFDAYRVFYKKESDLIAASEFLKERMEKKESVIFVAEEMNGMLTGFVQLYPIFSSTRKKRLWLLYDLFVSPYFRGKGISVMLMERAKQLARETQACGLTLETGKTNAIGNNLYPKMGFTLANEQNFYYRDVD